MHCDTSGISVQAPHGGASVPVRIKWENGVPSDYFDGPPVFGVHNRGGNEEKLAINT